MKQTRNSGFTLIELLVVIAIIGILATIVTVSFRGIQADARDTKRQAEVRGVGTAMELYYRDNGKYPEAAAELGGEVPAAVKTNLEKSFPDFPMDPQTTGSCGGDY
ncbi:MAG: type II secretion system protein, partial [bacterium]|nr:type II secretion system protein [bacterium]